MQARLVVRPAGEADLLAVARIFAHYVLATEVTFEVEPPSVEAWRERLALLDNAGWPFLVGVVDGGVVGYAYAGPWRPQPAYRHTVESSVYLVPGQTGYGYGRLLLGELMAAAAAAGAREVIAVVADAGSPASARLHSRAGFTEAGRLRRVGHKHGRTLDVVLMQAALPATPG